MSGKTISGVQHRAPNPLAAEIINALIGGGASAFYTTLLDVTDSVSRKIVVESNKNIDAYLTTDANQKYRMLIESRFPTVTNPPPGYVPPIVELSLRIGSNEQIVFSTKDGISTVNVLGDVPRIQLWNAGSLPSPVKEYSYRFTLTDRGFAIGMWSVNNVNGVSQNVMAVVQRPVNPTDGTTKVNGKAPIFAMWHDCTNSTNYFQWGIVREKDIINSVVVGPTNVPGRNLMYRFTLDWSHPNLFDNYSHIIKFPYGFATNRHLYMDELDLICSVNATAFANSQDVSITMYGESAERKYSTIWGAVTYGDAVNQMAMVVSGSRLGILSKGGGITPV